MFEQIFTLGTLVTFLTLTGLEIILGIDNVIFISLLVEHLPPHDRKKVRFIGLSLALILRIVMLLGVSWVMKLTQPLFTIYNFSLSGQHILLIAGGTFLIVKSIMELMDLFSGEEHQESKAKKEYQYFKVITQIVFIDLVLSFDSILTAVAMTNDVIIIIAAIIVSIIAMLASSQPIGEFIYANPSIKIIALNFIALVGIMLLLNGFDIHFDKIFLYTSMGASLITEIIIINICTKHKIRNR